MILSATMRIDYYKVNLTSVSLLSLPLSLAVSLVLQILFCIINDGMLVNPNESPTSAPSTLPLRSLQEILHNRIIQKKGEIHESHNRAYNERYGRDRKLHWVLAQIRCYCDDH